MLDLIVSDLTQFIESSQVLMYVFDLIILMVVHNQKLLDISSCINFHFVKTFNSIPECSKCESIHIAVPLPSKGSGKPWSMADGAVRLIFAAIPKWVRRATGTPRKSNVRAAGAHEAPTSDAAHEAATSVAAARSIADAALAEAAGGADEAERERVQAARNDAAMERVASGKRPARNPKRPTE